MWIFVVPGIHRSALHQVSLVRNINFFRVLWVALAILGLHKESLHIVLAPEGPSAQVLNA